MYNIATTGILLQKGIAIKESMRNYAIPAQAMFCHGMTNDTAALQEGKGISGSGLARPG